MKVFLGNETHLQKFVGFQAFSYGKWYHFGITYHRNSGYEVYLNGCIPTGRTKETQLQTPGIIDYFDFGCDNGRDCLRVHLDDLRFWTVKKSSHFMWWLWKMYE